MSKENHEKFIEEIREINVELDILNERKEKLIKNRELVDHLYVEPNRVLDFNRPNTYEYTIKGPVYDGYDLTSNNIINMCKLAGVNRKTLKTHWTKELNGEVTTISDREFVSFKDEKTAQKALDWLISRIMINKLKNT